MAICLRRVLRNCNPFSYSSGRCHPLLADQKNCTAISITTQINRSFIAFDDSLDNVPYQPKFSTGGANTAEGSSKNERLKNELSYVDNELFHDNIYTSPVYRNDFIYCAEECRGLKEKDSGKENHSKPLTRASSYQLQQIQDKLCIDLPDIFTRTMDCEIYHKDVIFENNIRGTQTIGIRNYKNQIAILRLYASLLFCNIKFQIMKITCHTDDGTVRVRWRIRGLPGLKVIFLFWKQVSNQSTSLEQEEVWLDGFSIFYVKSDGLIHKHIASKLMPDDAGTHLSMKEALAAKLAVMTGAHPCEMAFPMWTDAECMRFLKGMNNSHLSVSKWTCNSLILFIIMDKEDLAFVEEKIEGPLSISSHDDL